jgi:hypothetical protein
VPTVLEKKVIIQPILACVLLFLWTTRRNTPLSRPGRKPLVNRPPDFLEREPIPLQWRRKRSSTRIWRRRHSLPKNKRTRSLVV